MRLLVLAAVFAACSSHPHYNEDELVAWGKHVLAMPGRTACATEQDHPAGIIGHFDPDQGICFVRPSLIPANIAALGATYVTVEQADHHQPVVQLDFGGGFIEAHGVRIDGSGVHPFKAEEQ